ncbi:hypothetical protein QJS10_CPB20g00210 [Acorus calamus]|uniref:Uncharacterized protein n=1 Tax=Acorus calamus TaxID=4465 RepID=A0AAV9CEV0_ACOCL|nr:hypothetical protein QJS10_CPB20g00210 [Acorus calamus]
MTSYYLPDIYTWIKNLPPIHQWSHTNPISLTICSPSLALSATQNQNPTSITFTITANLHLPIALWTSSPTKPNQETQAQLFSDVIHGVLRYGPNKNLSFLRRPQTIRFDDGFKDSFNYAFGTLLFLVCLYEAPEGRLRSECLNALAAAGLVGGPGRRKDAAVMVMRAVGSNVEERWMRAVNLAVTNWAMTEKPTKTRVPVFSYAVSASGLWKVQLWCPAVAMDVESPSGGGGPPPPDERLKFSLAYQQLEGVVQLAYKVVVRENWIDIVVSVDNVRCDVSPLASNKLMAKRGTGAEEKHFPSSISIELTPTVQADILSVSVSKSSDNPEHEIGHEKGLEGSFEPQGPFIGLHVSASETVTMSMKPWKFEQSVHGYSACLNWLLHDWANGREVISSRPSRVSLFLRPRAWFRDRYSSVYRPFTKRGGVIFAGDEYGESVWWKVCDQARGRRMEWEIRGKVWVTYWPNKHRTFYSETRRMEFREILYLTLP